MRTVLSKQRLTHSMPTAAHPPGCGCPSCAASFELDPEIDPLFDDELDAEFDAEQELHTLAEAELFEADIEDAAWQDERRRRSGRFARGSRRGQRKGRAAGRRLSGGARRPRLLKRPNLRRPKPIRPLRLRRRRRIVSRPVTCNCPAHGTEFVRWVQSSLNLLQDARLPVSGVMSRATRDALRTFQTQEGLQPDGIAGPDTEAALMQARGAGSAPGAVSDAFVEAGGDGAGNEGEVSEFDELFELDGLEEEIRTDAAYVRWVQQALNSAINAGLATDGISGPKTISAIRDFQRKAKLTVDGIVGSTTELALKIASFSWPPAGSSSASSSSSSGTSTSSGPVPEVATQLPQSAVGLRSAKPGWRQYGIPETVAALRAIGREWRRRYPSGPPVQIADISRRGGGKLPPHGSHRMGIDVDIRFIRKDGNKTMGVNALTNTANFDKPRTQELVDIIRDNGVLPVLRLWVNKRIGLRNVNGDKIHNDHMHVRFYMPAHYDLNRMKKAAGLAGGPGIYRTSP